MNDSLYWISIEPYVYTEVKGDTALLFNSYSKRSYIVKDDAMLNVLTKIKGSERQGITITSNEYEKCHENIHLLMKRHLISFYQLGKNTNVTPFQFKDNVYFEKNFIDFSSDDGFALYHTAELFNELIQINVYLSSFCSAGCKNCQIISKQSLYCYTEQKNKFLSVELFEKLVQIVSGINCRINLLGGDIAEHPQINEMLSSIATQPSNKFYIYLNSIFVEKFLSKINIVPDNISFVLLCNNIEEYTKISKTVPHVLLQKIKEYKVLVFSEEDAVELNNVKKDNIDIVPIYTGTNDDFFRKYIYITNEDVQHSDLTISQILFNKKFNSINYGILYMFPDGIIKSRFLTEALGNISDGLENLLWKEMKRTDGWMKTRKEKPCCDCVYQYICPPPSDYEYIIGKPNLCDIKP